MVFDKSFFVVLRLIYPFGWPMGEVRLFMAKYLKVQLLLIFCRSSLSHQIIKLDYYVDAYTVGQI